MRSTNFFCPLHIDNCVHQEIVSFWDTMGAFVEDKMKAGNDRPEKLLKINQDFHMLTTAQRE